MKARVLKMGEQIDAKSVRERVMLFAAAAALIVFLIYSTLLTPLFARQTALRAEISQQQNNMSGIDAEITATVLAHQRDPDLQAKARLAAIRGETAVLNARLRGMQAGLVAPERIAPMLETILRSNGRLRLMGLKSMAASPLVAQPENAAPNAPMAPQASAIYRHGVELTVRGNYLDMVDYMHALEAMPTQLFWGKAKLEVEEYPNARLTLTLYTLSLDQKWMTL
jgi:MSHA biogenesis protein MshJ